MGFAAATYSVTTPGALPARITDDGIGCELWVENFVAAGASTGNFTVNYVNTVAGAKSVVMNVPEGVNPAIVSAPVAGQMQPVPIVAGDLGVKQLTSVANGSTFTSGTWGMTILKNIAQIEIPVANTGLTLDWSKVLADIHADACLFFYFLGNATTAPVALGTAWIIDK